MTKQFLPSKSGHTLDDAEFTIMVEPMPGTQLIYEHLRDCTTNVTKTYPPNTTLVVNNTCKKALTILGEVTKLIVEKNEGTLHLGWFIDEVYTSEVVIKENKGKISLRNTMDRVEIQTNDKQLTVWGKILEHVDVKVAGGTFDFFSDEGAFDIWVGSGCPAIYCEYDCLNSSRDYINTNDCPIEFGEYRFQ